MGQCKGVFYNATNYTLVPTDSVIGTSPSGPNGTWLQAPVAIQPGGETNLAFYGEAPDAAVFGKVSYEVQGQPSYTLLVYFNNLPPNPPTAEPYICTIPGE